MQDVQVSMNLLVFFGIAVVGHAAHFSNNCKSGYCYMQCTADNCDSVPPLGDIGDDVVVYSTDSSGDAMARRTLNFTNVRPSSWSHWQSIEVNTTRRFQKIEGFGGAFTDAVSANLATLTPATRNAILDQYFGAQGARYSIGRVPMASCDFSTHEYAYVAEGDFAANSFNLTKEDVGPVGKLDLVKAAMDKVPNGLKLFASVWTAPPWMKVGASSKDPWVGGSLNANSTYHEAWALYFSRFLSAYKSHGVDFWGVTVQNEPKELPGLLQQSWETMFYTPEEEAAFVKNFLGPQLRKDHPTVKIIVHDDQKGYLPGAVQTMLADKDVAQFVDGIGIHWYMLPGQSKSVAETHEWLVSQGLDDVFILGTEACSGFSAFLSPPHVGPVLGSWMRGQSYASDIIADINSWAVGWTDWNLVLDMSGGPNHAGNVVDAPILVDPKQPEVFYKQPMYYVMAHFSHFVPPGSVRIGTTSTGPMSLDCAGFVTPDGLVVLVVANSNSLVHKKFYIHDPLHGYVDISVKANSIQTIVWKAGRTIETIHVSDSDRPMETIHV